MRRILALLVAGLFVASLAVPAVAIAAPPWGGNVHVVSPTGTDDTAAIQTALNACSGSGASPGCTVLFQAATYYTKQVAAYNFQGTIKGAGEHSTLIQAKDGLPVTPSSVGSCAPNTSPTPPSSPCLWPNLFTFVNGTISVSDLAISEPALPGTATTSWTDPPLGGYYTTSLGSALYFAGTHADVSVDHVSITGLPDNTASLYGYNLGVGVHYTGAPLPLPGFGTLTGSLTVRNSTFTQVAFPVSVDGYHASNRVTIGGSPWAGNAFDTVIDGIDLESAQNSTLDVSYNTATASQFGMWVNYDGVSPTSPSQYRIHDNTFATTGVGPNPCCTAWGSAGIQLLDNSAAPYIQAQIWHNAIQGGGAGDGIDTYFTNGTAISGNTITLGPAAVFNIGVFEWSTGRSAISGNTVTLQGPYAEGIDATLTSDTAILGNTVTGSGLTDAVALGSVTRGLVIANNVTGATPAGHNVYPPDPGLGNSQIYVGTSASAPTTHSTQIQVVCLRHSDTVIDLGTGDHLVNCTQVTNFLEVTPQVAPALRAAPVRNIPEPKPYIP